MTFFFQEYFKIIILICFTSFLSFIILFLSYIFSTYKPDTEKLSTYECGFDPYDDARNVFDVRFYVVAILFLLFDVEILFFYPWCIGFSFLNITGIWSMIDFLLELIIGYAYIFVIGALDWK